MDLKMWLAFLMVCVVQAKVNKWTINVPSQVRALHGSCVIVPCTYTYPKVYRKWATKDGYWKRGETFVAANYKMKLTPEFRKRTEIMGSLEYGDCTLLMNGVRSTDVGPFYFQSKIRQRRYSFKTNPVKLQIYRIPEPPTMAIAVNKVVTASCTISYPCPIAPPTFYWNHSGRKRSRTTQESRWNWTTEATIKFVPSSTDFNKKLTCKVYRGGKPVQSSMIILSKV